MTQSTVIVHDFKKGSDPMVQRTSSSCMDIQEITSLIPHRYPMLLIDRMEDIEVGLSAVGIKNVSMNEWYFQGHFPEKPILPGVLIIEAMAQTAAALVMKSLQLENKLVYFMSVEEAKFRKPVVPGDVMRLKVTKEKNRGPVWKFKGEAFVEGALVAESIFSAMVADMPEG